MSVIWIEIIDTRGSTPRDVGTAMKVTAETTDGTIGGGALEHAAIQTARRLLSGEANIKETKVALGPGLGQCCGGAVTLRFGQAPRTVDRPALPSLEAPPHVAPIDLWIWGAGHVGRAIVRHCPIPLAQITWIDFDADRFPEPLPSHVTQLPAADMPMLAAQAPASASHLILTHSHEIDFALCGTLLKRGASDIGLIGSDTKRARFFRRLRAMGLDPSGITCPIGDKSRGKHPDAIAQGVVAAIIRAQSKRVAI